MNTKRITVGVAAAAAWKKNKKNGNMLLGEEELSLLNLWSRARKGVKREKGGLRRIHPELPRRRRRRFERVAGLGGATSATMRSC